MTEPSEPTDHCVTTWSPGWQINYAATEGICLVVEAIGWDLATPHGGLIASTEIAIGVCNTVGEREAELGSSIQKAWNRIIARNMVYTEGTIQILLTAVRGAVNFAQEGNCYMAQNTLDQIYNQPDGRVPQDIAQ